ncbi:MAG: prephenate dehydrogenase [Spirochaetes bacterium]|nr:prephenate dehydrogenase [Spirochaetota bacterium]
MFKKIAIIGLGLLGASFALAVRKQYKKTRIIGIGRDKKKIAEAVRLGIVHEVSDSRTKGIAGADLIVLAPPAASVLPLLAEIAPHLKHGMLVTDFASTKHVIVSGASKLNLNGAVFVGCHPIAGGEKTGFQHARADLFRGKTVVITPDATTPAEPLEELTALWHELKAVIVQMNAQEHDSALAMTSHLVHLASAGLAGTVSRQERLAALTGNGFLDTTRIAKGDEVIWTDIVKTNRSDILSALKRYRTEMKHIERLIARRKYDALADYLKHVKEYRMSI